MLYYRNNYMDIQSIIKNAIAKKLDEHKIVEVDNTPQVNSTSDYVKYLAEAVKFRIEELSKDTLQSYKAKAETQTSGPKGEKRSAGVAKAKGKIARKEMGLDRDRPSTPSKVADRLATHQGPGSPKGRKPSDEEEANAASRRTPQTPISQINRMGVRKGGSGYVTRTGLTVGDAQDSRLKLKTDAANKSMSDTLSKMK